MKYDLKSSELPANFVLGAQKENMIWEAINVNPFYSGLFAAMAEFLAIHKNTEKKSALVIKDIKGDFMMAAIISYHVTEDETSEETTPDNWYLAFTTYEDDLKDVESIYSSNDLSFQSVLTTCLHSLYGIRFVFPQYIHTLVVNAVSTLTSWLDANAKADEVTEIECEGYFVASVAVEGDEKVLAITPSGELKKIIKEH